MTRRSAIAHREQGQRSRALCVAAFLGLIAVFGLATRSAAHEVRPAYLELREDRAGEFDVLFKTPMRGELRLSLAPSFSGQPETLTPITMRATGDAAVQTWRIRVRDPLRGQTVRVAGLEATMTDALVRIVFLDGFTWT